jgi:hypothetical protein
MLVGGDNQTTDPGWLRLGRGCQLWKYYYTAPFDEELANPEDYAQTSPFLKFSAYTLQDTFFLFQAGLQERTSEHLSDTNDFVVNYITYY